MANFFGEFVAKLVLEVKDFRARLREAAQDAEQEAGRIGKATKEMGDAVRDAVDGQVDAATAARAALALLGPAAGAAAAAAAVGVAAFEQGRAEARAYESAIANTGNAAGVTANSLADMARNIDASVGTQALAARTLAELAGSGKVAGENMQGLAQSAIEAERSMGQSIDTTVGHFAKLADAPVKASLQLNDSMNYLTAATFDQIKAAEDLGDKERAAALAQETYAGALRDRAAQSERNLGTLQRAWRGLREAALEAWDAMLNVGREATKSQELEAVQKRIRELQDKLAAGDGFADTAGGAAVGARTMAARSRLQAELDGLQAQAAALQGVIFQQNESARVKGEQAKAERAYIDLLQEGDKHLSNQEKQRRAVAAATQTYQDALKNENLTQEQRNKLESTYLAIVSDITKVKERGGGARAGKSELEKQLEAEAAAMAKAAGVNTDYLAQLTLLQSARDRGRMSEAQYVEAVERLIAVQPSSVKLTREQTEATKAAEKAAREAARGHEQFIAALERGAQDAGRRADALEVEERAAVIAAGGYYSLAQAVELVTIARLKEKQEGLLGNEEAYLAVQREIEARERLVGLIGSKEARTANEKAAKEAERTWDRTAKTVGDTLADYIMGGGRNAAQYLKRLFSTLVLQPEVQAFAGGIMGTGPAAAASGSNVLGLANNASSLNTLYGTASQALVGGTAGASMASLGYANAVGMLGGDAIGALATANGMWAGVATGAQAAAQAAIAANTAMAAGTATALEAGTLATAAGAGAGAGAGITSALAAIPGWGLALAGVLALGAVFGGKKSTPHMGGAGSYSAEGGASTGLAVLDQGLTFGVGERYYNSEAEKAAVGISQGIVQLLDSTAQSFGQQAGYYAATAFADDSSKDGAWGSLRIMRGDEKVLDWADTQTSKWAPKVFADGEQGQKEYAAAIAASARDALKTALGDATWAKDMLDTLGDSVTLEGLSGVVAQINQAKATFVSFGQYMPVFGSLAESAVSALVNASGGVAPLQANMATFVDQFYTDAEKLAINTENVRTALAELGFEMPATRDEFKALVQAQLALGDEGARTAAALLGLSGAFAGVTQSAEDAAQAARQLAEEQERAAQEAIDKAYRELEAATGRDTKAIDLQRDALNEQRTLAAESLSLITGVFSIVATSARDLFGQVESVAAMQAAQGRAFIEQALATAQVTGRLPDSQQLSDAISAARGGIDSGTYANDAARNFDRLVLANQLKGLADISGEQKTAQERQIDLLDSQLKGQDKQSKLLQEQLDYWREQIDIASGTLNATLSVSDAIGALQALLFPGRTGQDNAQGSGGAVFGGTSPGGTSWAQQEPARYSQVRSDGSGGHWYDPIRDDSIIAHLDRLAPIYHAYDGTGDLAGLAEAIKAAGGTVGDLSVLSGYYESDWRKALADAGIPLFARGGLHSGGLRVVGERGWELEATGPARYWNQQQLAHAMGGGDNAGLIAEVRMLRAVVEALLDAADATADSAETTAGVLVRVTGNGNGMRIVQAPI